MRNIQVAVISDLRVFCKYAQDLVEVSGPSNIKFNPLKGRLVDSLRGIDYINIRDAELCQGYEFDIVMPLGYMDRVLDKVYSAALLRLNPRRAGT